MTVIAWDGKTLAVDRQVNVGDACYPAKKCRRLKDGTLLAWSGYIEAGLILADWYENGADLNKFPFKITDKELVDLVVVSPKGICTSFCQAPWGSILYLPFMAWGAGRLGAMVAMEMGADAVKAVEVTCRYCNCSGMGIDSYTLGEVG